MQGGFATGLSTGLVVDTAGLFTQGFSISLYVSFVSFFCFHHIIMMPCISFSFSRYLVCSVYSLLSMIGIYTDHSSFMSFISPHASFGIVNKLVKDTNAFLCF